MNKVCIIGIAGYSGSGKTTLISKIIPELKNQGLSVGVLKHIHHKPAIDIRGKDTDIFFRTGADIVMAHDDTQGFERFRNKDNPFSDLIERFPAALDVIIVEGHKEMNVPGIWLEERSSKNRPVMAGPKRTVVFRDEPDYHQKVLGHIRHEMEKFHCQRPVMAGLLIGGKSTRMGVPKSLLKFKGMTLAARSFKTLSAVSARSVLLGSGHTPAVLDAAMRLSDVTGVKGPLAGMLSAFRWSPDSAWLISSVDMPLMSREAWNWLIGQRRPGIWAILPKIKGSRGVETTGALYEPMIFEHVEALASHGTASLQEIARHPKVMTSAIPDSLAYAWSNVNTPDEWKKILCLHGQEN